MNVLFLSRWFPYPPSNGSKLRIYNLLRGLAKDHEIRLITFADQPYAAFDLAEMETLCRRVQVVPWVPFQPNSARARLHFLNPKPRSMVVAYSPRMDSLIREEVKQGRCDMVIASQVDMAIYSHCFRGIPALFEEVEVGVLYEQYRQATSPWQRTRRGLTWTKHSRYLRSLLNQFQMATVVSERERQLVNETIAPTCPLEIVPNCVDMDSYADVPKDVQPNTLIFTGAFTYNPNYEAMCWFLERVFPAIQAQIPDVHLTITGNHANRPLPQHSNVTLTGFVDDVRPLIAQSTASVVPLHTGGGTRLKILEAMALGTPVIATSKGAEGLDAQHDRHLLVADRADEMVQLIVKILQDGALCRRLTVQARQLIQDHYNWNVIMPRVLDLVDQVRSRV
jgi:sugar transferase (PEP-CTERM/EpsH1 system associated)